MYSPRMYAALYRALGKADRALNFLYLIPGGHTFLEVRAAGTDLELSHFAAAGQHLSSAGYGVIGLTVLALVHGAVKAGKQVAFNRAAGAGLTLQEIVGPAP